MTPVTSDGGEWLQLLDDKELMRLASLVGTDAKNPKEKLAKYVAQELERAKKEARIEEQKRLITDIDKNESDKYPTLDPDDNLTYISHGHALACKQIRRNAEVRIAELEAAINEEKEG
jgi:hypothetical protein